MFFVIHSIVFAATALSLISTIQSINEVKHGKATLDTLRDLTGVFDLDLIQSYFGAPNNKGVYNVSIESLRERRTLMSQFMSSVPADSFFLILCTVAFFISAQTIIHTIIASAAIYNLIGYGYALFLALKNIDQLKNEND